MDDQAAAPNADPERAFDGHYQLGSEIGAGALGVVYRGVDEKLDKAVAIKVWHARFEDGVPQREQYDAEARALTALEHPNIVAISDYGIAGQAPYLVMELLEGEPLVDRMRASRLTSAQAQGYMQSVLRALGYMHMRGIVHRNIKPDNVFLQKGEAGETLKLLDMGLESLAANDNAAAGGAAVLLASAYDAPEREQGIEPDGRADVYGAGVLMLEMLSGREPARDVLRAAGQADGGPLEWLNDVLPNALPEVRTFIAKAIAYERSARFGNGDQMLRALLELPTPWLIGEEEPAPIALATSARPKSRPAHSDLGSSETVALPAAESGAEPETAGASSQPELKPFGLVARLRARKKLWLIAGGVVAFGVGGATLAAFLSDRAQTEKPAQEAAAPPKETATAAQAGAPAPVLEHPYHAEEAEQIEEHEQATAKAAAGASAPAVAGKPVAEGSQQAPAEPQPKTPAVLSARDAAPSGAVAPAVVGPSKADGVASARTEAAARELSATVPPPLLAAGDEPAVRPPAALPAEAHEPAVRPPAALPAEAHEPAVRPPAALPAEALQPMAAAKGENNAGPREQGAAHGDTTAAPQEPAAPPGEAPHAQTQRPGESPGAAAADTKAGESPTPTAAAEPAQPAPAKNAPTPQQLGSERHIHPDQAEIRQMLALALKSSPRVAAADPWKMGDAGIPDSLQALREAIAHGERGSASNIKALRRYNATNHDDVFGHLLLAGFYANRGYSLDALDQYDLAYRIDSSSRGAPEMLNHALNMVAQGIAQSEAERFIDRVYGREALASITQQLRASGTTAAAAARLRQLQARLAGKRR